MGGQSIEMSYTHVRFRNIGTVKVGDEEFILWINEDTLKKQSSLPEGYELCDRCDGMRTVKYNHIDSVYVECKKCKGSGVINWIDRVLR